MPTPWLSWPERFASTRWSATMRASSALLPPASRIISAASRNACGWMSIESKVTPSHRRVGSGDPMRARPRCCQQPEVFRAPDGGCKWDGKLRTMLQASSSSSSSCWFVPFLLACVAMPTFGQPAPDSGWIDLTAGGLEQGWRQLGGEAEYALDGDTIVGTAVIETPNSFLATTEEYGDFALQLEFKVDEGLNAGIQIRSHSDPDYRNGTVHGYQVEIDSSERAWTAGIYDEARRGWLFPLSLNPAASQAFRPGRLEPRIHRSDRLRDPHLAEQRAGDVPDRRDDAERLHRLAGPLGRAGAGRTAGPLPERPLAN